MIDPEARGTEGAFFSPELRDKIIEYIPPVALERGLITEVQYYAKDPDGVLTLGICEDIVRADEPTICLEFRYVERYTVTPPIVELLAGELASGVPISDSILSILPPFAAMTPDTRSRAIQTECVVDAETGEVYDYHKFNGILNEHHLVVQESEIEAAQCSSPEERLVRSVVSEAAILEADEYAAGLKNFDDVTVAAMLAVFDRVV